MLFDILFIADLKKIGEHMQQLTDLNTAHENKGKIDYDCKVGMEPQLKLEHHQEKVLSVRGIQVGEVLPYNCWNSCF